MICRQTWDAGSSVPAAVVAARIHSADLGCIDVGPDDQGGPQSERYGNADRTQELKYSRHFYLSEKEQRRGRPGAGKEQQDSGTQVGQQAGCASATEAQDHDL